MMTYINTQGQQYLKKFTYKGGNDSITYAHLWSPLADQLLKFTPSHLAPNLISTISLIVLTLAHLIFVSGLDESKKLDSWRAIVMGISIFIYQNLDNLDGKQARKTGSSSPLGMLFDHGIDAMTSFLISIQMLELLELQNQNAKVFCLFIIVMIVFFCAMWSQYCVGSFRLGQINPIDEGLPSYAIFSIVSIFIPHNFWNNEHLLGTYNQEVMSLFICIVILVIYFMVRQNYAKTQRKTQDINYALLLPITYFLVLLSLYFSNRNPFEQALWPIYYSLLFSWSRNMIQIQVCSVTHQQYNPFNLSTLCFALLSIIYLFLDINPATYFSFVAILSAAIFFEFAISISRQIAGVLQINIFTLKNTTKNN